MGSGGELADLRALAEAASSPMACGGHRSAGSLMQCEGCSARNNASVELRSGLNPTAVLALLDRVEAAEADARALRVVVDAAIKTIARVQALADEWERDSLGTDRLCAADLRAAMEGR